MGKKYLILLYIVIIAGACRKEEQVNEPALEVEADKQTIKAGETVNFSLHGNADFVSFYAGTPLNDYAYKDGRTVGAGVVMYSFDSYTFSGTQANQLSLVVSNDFDGIYGINDIRKATWTDITGSYSLANAENTFMPAGSSDITAFAKDGKTFYLAYKYKAAPAADAGVGKIWKIRNTVLTNQTEISTSTLGNLVTSEWKLVLDENTVPDASRNFVVSTALAFRSNAAPNDKVYQEVWIVSKGFKIGSQDLGPDLALPVKNFTLPWVSTWSQQYTKPGTYNATFIGANRNVYGDKKTIKQVQISVTQ
jgi:hypothetical protein